MWQTIITVAVLVLIIGGASVYIYREKKKGTRCIGCPDNATCPKAACKKGCPCKQSK